MKNQTAMVKWGRAFLWLEIATILLMAGFAMETMAQEGSNSVQEKAIQKTREWLEALAKKDKAQLLSLSGFPFFASGIGDREKPCAQEMSVNSKDQFALLSECLFSDGMLFSELKELSNAKEPMNSQLGEAKNWKVVTPEEAVSKKFITKFQAKREKRDFASLFRQLSVGKNRILVNVFFLGPIGTAWQFLFAVEPSGDRFLVVGVVAYNQPYE